MSDQGHERFELPPELRSMAENSVKQAREAFEKLVANAETAAGSLEERGASLRAGAREVGAKAVAFAEQNMQASLDYAQSLVHAKDLSEMMKLHGDYLQAQMKSLAEQASELGRTVSRAAMDLTRPKS